MEWINECTLVVHIKTSYAESYVGRFYVRVNQFIVYV